MQRLKPIGWDVYAGHGEVYLGRVHSLADALLAWSYYGDVSFGRMRRSRPPVLHNGRKPTARRRKRRA